MHNLIAKIKIIETGLPERLLNHPLYLMAPDSTKELQHEAGLFNRGHKETVSSIVGLAYRAFLADSECFELPAEMVPPVAYRFNRKAKTATVQADHFRLEIWVEVEK